MTPLEKERYRQGLERFIGALADNPLYAATGNGETILASNPTPSARKNDMAMVVENELMAVRKGLSDEILEGMMMCTYLATLLASEKYRIETSGWRKVYESTLVELGWVVTKRSNVYGGAVGGHATVGGIAQLVTRQVQCNDAEDLVGQSIAKLENSPKALKLIELNSAFLLNILPVPTLTRDGKVLLGAVFVTIPGKLTIQEIIRQQRDEPDAVGRVGTGFALTLKLDKLDALMEVVGPALRDLRQRLIEAIRL